MSRSRKKTPKGGVNGCPSDKASKQAANSLLRSKVKIALSKGAEILPELREVSDVWQFHKEGKIYNDKYPEWLRK